MTQTIPHLVNCLVIDSDDRFDRLQQHPQPAQPRFSGESVVWRNEHSASADPTDYRFGTVKVPSALVSPTKLWDHRVSS